MDLILNSKLTTPELRDIQIFGFRKISPVKSN